MWPSDDDDKQQTALAESAANFLFFFWGGGGSKSANKLTPKRKNWKRLYFLLYRQNILFVMQTNYFLIDSRCDPLPMRLWEWKEHFCIWNLKSANYLSPFWKRLLFPPTFITVEVYRNSVKKSPRNRWPASVGGPKRTPPPPTMFLKIYPKLNPRPTGVFL